MKGNETKKYLWELFENQKRLCAITGEYIDSIKNASLDRIADKLATAIIEEIQFLKVNYTAGLVAPSGGGPVTGTITHTVS